MSNGKSDDKKQNEDEVKKKDEIEKEKNEDHNQDLLDEGIEESFPARDPPSVGHVD